MQVSKYRLTMSTIFCDYNYVVGFRVQDADILFLLYVDDVAKVAKYFDCRL